VNYADSSEFFEIPRIVPQRSGFVARYCCVKDFLKKCAIFPFALLYKASKTIFRVLGVFFSLACILFTLGSCGRIREMFTNRMSALAKDLADWVLLPFAVLICFVRLILGFVIHPNLYFNRLA